MGGAPPHPGETRENEFDDQPVRGDTPRGRRAFSTETMRCEVWGVLNVTPDSFSDGGRFMDAERAALHGRRMLAEGADVIDVGGESSRPAGTTYGEGALRVDVEEEIARVLPVIERLAPARLSIDTVKPEVARAALAAGARIVNDVSCGASAELLAVVAETDAELVLMHSRDGGRVDAETTAYRDVVREVREELENAVERALRIGVGRTRIYIDPGIGFAKSAEQSRILLANLDVFVRTGYPVLVGASRKSFIARTMAAAGLAEPPPAERLGGSLAALTAAVLAGVRAVRVHDVAPSLQAVRMAEALRETRRTQQ